MIIDKLPNESITKIQVNTKFKPQIYDGEDFKTVTIKAFHDAVHEVIEKYLTENDEIEERVLDIMDEQGELPVDVKEFSDFGQISIQIIEEQPVDIKQDDLSDEEVKKYSSKKNIKIDKKQTKLIEDDK